jgi:NDP-sugar pyrophosphorylase family protein
VYLLERRLIEELPAGEASSLERGWLQRWTTLHKVLAFRCAGPFLDIGTPASYAAAPAYFTDS